MEQSMKKKYDKYAEIYRALGDINRLMIVDMLTEGELCACKILEKFVIKQPTLSHHMKTLCACRLVKGRKQGKWTYYSISAEGRKNAVAMLQKITSLSNSNNKNRNKGCDE
jgi:ArsR family transcriptional regulator